MSSSGKYLFNAGGTPRNDRENLQQAHSSKSNAAIGRNHLRSKHAFVDLKNVMHNTPLKESLKPQVHTATPFESKKSPLLLPIKKRPIIKNREPEDLECFWLENSLMIASDFEEKVQRLVEKKKKQKEIEWKKFEEDLLLIPKRPDKEIFEEYKSVEHLSDILTELYVVEQSILSLPSIPNLPTDDFERDDFFKF